MSSSQTWVAVADLHGHADHLAALLAHLDETLGDAYSLCTLGDYVDNGPQVPKLLDLLIELRERRPDRFVPIMGNHDLALLRALGWPGDEPDERWYEHWHSYWSRDGETPCQYAGGTLPPTAAAFARLLPPGHAHREFLASLPWVHDTGEYLFVHAGMEPGPLEPQVQALAEQRLPPEHLFTPQQLRGKHLSKASDPTWDRVVISAHNKRLGGPRFVGSNRICLSGEVDATDVLHAVVLPERRWLFVGPDLRVHG